MSAIFQPSKVHGILKTPLFQPEFYANLDILVQVLSMMITYFLLTGSAQRLYTGYCVSHAFLIAFSDYKCKTLLPNLPIISLLWMYVIDVVLVVATIVMPFYLDGYDAVLPAYVYQVAAVIFSPVLLMLDALPPEKSAKKPE